MFIWIWLTIIFAVIGIALGYSAIETLKEYRQFIKDIPTKGAVEAKKVTYLYSLSSVASVALSIITFIAGVNMTSVKPLPATKSPDNIDAAWLKQMVKSKIAWHIPDTIEYSKSYRAVVTVTQSAKDSTLFENDVIKSYAFEKYQIKDIQLTSKVLMHMEDPTNEISTIHLDTPIQFVNSRLTIWRWNLTAKSQVSSSVAVTATAFISTPIGILSKSIPIVEKKIEVKASRFEIAKDFFQRNWKWVITAIGAILTGFLIPFVKWVLKKRKKAVSTVNPIGFRNFKHNK